LYSAHSAKDHYGAVEDSEGALDFDCEIDMAGGIDEIDVEFLPLSGDSFAVIFPSFDNPITKRRGTLNRNPLLPFQIHGIHLRAHGISPAHFVYVFYPPGVEEHAFCGCRFTAVDVGCDSYVADAGETGGFFGREGGDYGFLGESGGVCEGGFLDFLRGRGSGGCGLPSPGGRETVGMACA